MTRPVRVDAEAREEIEAAVAWYDSQTAKSTLGDELLDAVDDAFAKIGERPESFSLAPEVPERLRARRIALGRFPYQVVFLEMEDHIRVLAFAHARRRPGYWRSRV